MSEQTQAMTKTIISREEARKIAGQSIMIRMPGTRL